MKTTVSTKGRLILPARMCRLDRIEPGQVFDIERISRGEYRLVRREPSINEGLIDWLVSCPDTEWFVPIESATTNTL
jgi:bifunctional DNA-binding transcriptional regulator/antitoxin component of YhaV-PrlF toxin-antitoxin module